MTFKDIEKVGKGVDGCLALCSFNYHVTSRMDVLLKVVLVEWDNKAERGAHGCSEF